MNANTQVRLSQNDSLSRPSNAHSNFIRLNLSTLIFKYNNDPFTRPFFQFAEEFKLSKEARKCEEDCPQPCQYVEYDTFLSYAGLQRDVFVDYLLSFLNGTQKMKASSALNQTYRPLLKMTKPERDEYIK